MDIHNSVMDFHNSIMVIHNSISKIPNSIMIWFIKDIHDNYTQSLRQLWMSIITLLLNKVERYGVPKGTKPHNHGAP